ncbi:MAG: PPC domain-containing protein [Verrucomicrobiota bacterium]
MNKIQWFGILGLAGWLMLAHEGQAQTRPYLGFVYPAGGQQGTLFQVKLGGQGLESIDAVMVSGTGVTAKVVDYQRFLGPQEITLLNEQMRELKRAKTVVASATMMSSDAAMMTSGDAMMMSSGTSSGKTAAQRLNVTNATQQLIARIERRTRENVNRPACPSLANLVYLEVTIDANAPPGERELRLVTLRGGPSNPLVFHVGQVPEVCRKPMLTAAFQVLGKEDLALRKRPEEEAEVRITVPCTMNGQIASGEVNRYRFEARKGQRLVISTQGRQLMPYIADAVPGWFQPVLALQDASGKEVAFDDDYRFKPDPIIFYEVPKDGEYVLSMFDSIYRGREDFVYRITIGELPMITSIFPLGGQVGASVDIKMKGWNLADAVLTPPAANARPGIHLLAANRKDLVSNRVPFMLDTLPDTFEKEPNDTPARAQKVQLPIIINGRMDKTDDVDVFQFEGKAGENVFVEAYARRLDSPMDPVIKLTDASGKLLGFSDDREDLGAGVNTHHADCYFSVKLPADGAYYVHIADTSRKSGEEYAYRLRISAPRPDFALRVVPSSLGIRGRTTASVSIHVVRKDGFTGPIKLGLKNPPKGFSAMPITLSGTQAVARLTIKSDLIATKDPVNLTVEGTAKLPDREITHEAVPAEDRMQAFLWRHLVPAQEFKVAVFDPSYEPPPKRVPQAHSTPKVVAKVEPTKTVSSGSTTNATTKLKFSKNQIAGRLRQLKLLYEEGLLTDAFYGDKVAECETQ